LIADVEIYALQGETDKALAALRQAVNEGWRSNWRYLLEINPNLDSIRNEPAFQAMLEEVRADIAKQLERVRAMEPTGQICAGA
jgi:glucan phosphorylase